MRRLITLGLLALSLSFLSNPLFAGDASDCETIRDDPNRALYGLCIAYWNTTNAVARAKIMANFVKKGGVEEEMPGLAPSELDDPDSFVECTCWLQEEHIQAILEDSSILFTGADVYFCGSGWDLLTLNGLEYNFFAEATTCEYVHNSDSTGSIDYLSPDAEITCRAQVHELIEHFTGYDCAPDS